MLRARAISAADVAWIALALALCSPAAALAQSLTGNTGSAGIASGRQAVELRVGANDDGRAAWRVHYDHALTDWYQYRVVGAFSRRQGQDWAFDGAAFENRFQWREEGADGSGLAGGLRLNYTFVDGGGPDEADIRLIVSDKFGDGWEWRGNLIAGFEAGRGGEGGADLQSRFELTRALGATAIGARKWRLGAEVFSTYGNTRDLAAWADQRHQLGPVLKAEWPNGVYMVAAVRVGLTDEADDLTGRVSLGRTF